MKIASSILWAVDVYEDQTLSVEKVARTAKEFGSEIILLHVLDKAIRGASIQEFVETEVKVELEQLAARLRENEDYTVRLRLAYGNVAEKVMDVAEAEDVNMIIMNRGSEFELTGKALGLNAQKVSRSSQKSLVIIPNHGHSELQQVLCPVDFSTPSTLALNSAILYARKTGARLRVVHIVEPIRITSSRLQNAGMDEKTENKNQVRMGKSNMENYLSTFDYSDVNLRSEVLLGVSHLEIIRLSEQADTVYLGSTGKSGLRRTILGSVSEKVLRGVRCNAVVVKSEEMFKLRLPAELEDIQKHYEQARELEELGYMKGAISQYLQCLNINDLHMPSLWALASVYETLGNKEKTEYYQDLALTITNQMLNRKIEEEIRRNYNLAG